MKMVKQIVESGALGNVYYIQTGGGRRRGIPTPFGTTFIEKDKGAIGAMGDIGCYSLDMVLNAIGYPKPLTVSGYTSDFFGKDPEYFEAEGKPAEYANLFGVDDFGAAFIRLEGGIVLDPSDCLQLEIDTCWVHYGGEDPSAYVRKYAGRLDVLHLKDFVCKNLGGGPVYALIGENGEEKEKPTLAENDFKFRPVGYGMQNFAEILAAAEDAGVEYVIVEQDDSYDTPSLESAKMSRDYLRTLGI